jgi:hypothetical protein
LIDFSADQNRLADDLRIAVLEGHLSIDPGIFAALLGYGEVIGKNIDVNASRAVIQDKPAA